MAPALERHSRLLLRRLPPVGWRLSFAWRQRASAPLRAPPSCLDWPARQEITLPHGRICFRQVGKGPDLIFLHGMVGFGSQWRDCVLRLGTRFTCWIPELPGISASSPMPDETLAGLAHWLRQAIAAWGIADFALLASSWGGAMALQFAAEIAAAAQPPFAAPPPSGREGGLQRMVLAAPMHPFWEPNQRQRLMLSSPWRDLAAAIGGRLPLWAQRQLLAANFVHPEKIPPDAPAEYRTTLGRPGLSHEIGKYALDLDQQKAELRRRLPNVRVPVLLVWGSRDRIIPPSSASALQQAIPGAHLRILDDLGHLSFTEAPDEFLQAVGPFLDYPNALA